MHEQLEDIAKIANARVASGTEDELDIKVKVEQLVQLARIADALEQLVALRRPQEPIRELS